MSAKQELLDGIMQLYQWAADTTGLTVILGDAAAFAPNVQVMDSNAID